MRLGVVMDPLGSISVKKDSTYAMLLAAQARDWQIVYFELPDLLLRDGEVLGRGRILTLRPGQSPWYALEPPALLPLRELDIVLMRKDPPVDQAYLYATQLLQWAEDAGVLVVNRPRALREFNEKLFAARFPDLMPPTLVSAQPEALRAFLAEQQDIILKPLDGMGGRSIFRLGVADPNVGVILETLTEHGQRYAMAQTFLPAIREGDKRILMVAGSPVPYALARIPAPGESRGNLAAGGRGEGRALTAADRALCARIAPTLREHGILFAGLDVIGTRLTEINITSPTCIQELNHIYNLDIAGDLLTALEAERHR